MVVRSNNELFSAVVLEELGNATAYLFLLRNGEHRKFAEKNGKPVEPDEILASCWEFLQSQLEELLAEQSVDC